jgi:hypothetical protein
MALAGPPWSQVDCKTAAVSQVFSVQLSAPGSATMVNVPGLTGAATDLAFDASGTLVLATPCASGTTGGALAGSGIFALGTHNGSLTGILGDFKVGATTVDPDDPELTTMPRFAQLAVSGGGAPVQVRLPSDRFLFEDFSPSPQVTEVSLPPSSIEAYWIAASPDGAHLVFADRVHYNAKTLRTFELDDTTGSPVFYCTLDLNRDVYHMSEVDLQSGVVGFRQATGVVDTKIDMSTPGCNQICYNCDPLAGCVPGPPLDCTESEGYASSGISVLLGSR